MATRLHSSGEAVMMGHQIPLAKVTGRCARSRTMGAVHSPEANRDLAVTPDCPPAKTNPSPDFNFFDYANLSGVTASSFRFPMLSTAKVNPMPQTFNIEVSRVIHFSIVRSSAAKLFSYAKGAAGVSSVGFSIQGGKPVFNVTLEESRQPIIAPWYLRESQYEKFLGSISRVRQQAV
jgi:hypothetical protein